MLEEDRAGLGRVRLVGISLEAVGSGLLKPNLPAMAKPGICVMYLQEGYMDVQTRVWVRRKHRFRVQPQIISLTLTRA